VEVVSNEECGIVNAEWKSRQQIEELPDELTADC
jgi:hypothetical protein